MPYNKPSAIKLDFSGINGTEAKTVETLNRIQKILMSTLKEGDVYESSRHSLNYAKGQVSKTYLVAKEAEAKALELINAQSMNFAQEPEISTSIANTKTYNTKLQGEKAIAYARAQSMRQGGTFKSYESGKQELILPVGKARKNSVLGKAEEYSSSYEQKEEELKAKKETTEKKEAEKTRVKQEKEAEKEQKKAEDDAKKEKSEQAKRNRAVLVGIGLTVLFLKKIIGIIENILLSAKESGKQAFEDSIQGNMLNLSTLQVRELKTVGTYRGIGDAPLNAVAQMQSMFGTVFGLNANKETLGEIAKLIGSDVEKLVQNFSSATDPVEMVGTVIDPIIKKIIAGKDVIGNQMDSKSALASWATELSRVLGNDFSTLLISMYETTQNRNLSPAERAEGGSFNSFITSPELLLPSNSELTALSESYKQFTKAVTNFQGAVDVLKTRLFPKLLDNFAPLVESATQSLAGASGNIADKVDLKDRAIATNTYIQETVTNLKSIHQDRIDKALGEDFISVGEGRKKTKPYTETQILSYISGLGLPDNLTKEQETQFRYVAGEVASINRLNEVQAELEVQKNNARPESTKNVTTVPFSIESVYSKTRADLDRASASVVKTKEVPNTFLPAIFGDTKTVTLTGNERERAIAQDQIAERTRFERLNRELMQKVALLEFQKSNPSADTSSFTTTVSAGQNNTLNVRILNEKDTEVGSYQYTLGVTSDSSSVNNLDVELQANTN